MASILYADRQSTIFRQIPTRFLYNRCCITRGAELEHRTHGVHKDMTREYGAGTETMKRREGHGVVKDRRPPTAPGGSIPNVMMPSRTATGPRKPARDQRGGSATVDAPMESGVGDGGKETPWWRQVTRIRYRGSCRRLELGCGRQGVPGYARGLAASHQLEYFSPAERIGGRQPTTTPS